MSYSLEKQLSRRVIVLNAIMFFIVLVVLNIAVSLWLVHEEDELIQSKANVIAHLITHMRDGIHFGFSDRNMPDFESTVKPEYFQIWINNDVFEKSRSLKLNNLPFKNINKPVELTDDIVLPDGRRGRMIQVTFYLQGLDDKIFKKENSVDNKIITIVVAKEREKIDFLINSIHLVTLFLTVVIIFILNFMVKKTVRKSLLPMSNINHQIRLLSAEKLQNKIEVADLPDELNEFVFQFNKMLSRLDLSFYREQRFASDVAHELRTPVAELLTMSEVALKWSEDPAFVQGFYSDVYDSSVQMMVLINDLLALARCDKGDFRFDSATVYLNDLIETCWQRFSELADKKEIRLNCSIDHRLLIKTGVIEFEKIINNLISNAISYGEFSSELLIQAESQGEIVVLQIQNMTDQLEDEDLKVMFDRFWRKNKVRSSSDHSGLGLSIVKAYSEVLNLKIATELSAGKIFTVSVAGIRRAAICD